MYRRENVCLFSLFLYFLFDSVKSVLLTLPWHL